MKPAVLIFLAAVLSAQTITRPNPLVPPTLAPMASQGDQERCVVTPWGTKERNFHVDCKIGSRVTQTITAIHNTTWIEAGKDLIIELVFDENNPKVVHYWATVNTRDSSGGVTAVTLIAQADITW